MFKHVTLLSYLRINSLNTSGFIKLPAELVSYPDPYSTAADGLHHRYVESGSGEVLYSFLSRCPGMLGHQSDLRYAIIAYLSYCLKLLVIGCTASY